MKLDLKKAYDKVNWDFFEVGLNHFGFPRKIIVIIMRCVRTTSSFILWNEEPTTAFRPSQGIRQGDHLSLYLFILYMESLSHMINQAVNQKLWKYFKTGIQGPSFSHLFFADDIILFAKALVNQAEVIMRIFNDFQKISSQVISINKSKLFIASSTPNQVVSGIKRVCGITIMDDLGKYLGVLLIHSRITRHAYSYIIDRIQKCLTSWKSHCLSIASRATLIQSVIAAMPIYTMQSVRLHV